MMTTPRSLITLSLCVLSLASFSVHAKDGEIEAPRSTATVLPAPDLTKAQENLSKIIAKVREQNPDMVNAAESNLSTTDWAITKSITLNLMVRGKIYNELGVEVSSRETSLLVDRLTSGKIVGQMKVNGYELIKKTLTTRNGQPSEEARTANLDSGAKACEKANALTRDAVRKDQSLTVAYLDCALDYYLLKSNSFSEFLVSVQPLAVRFRDLANDAAYEELKHQAGPYGAFFIYHLFTGNEFTVCTGTITQPLCLGQQYVHLQLSSGLMGVTHASGEIYVNKDSIEFSISVYSFQWIANQLAGGQSSSSSAYIPFSDIQNYVISQLARMTDADIENAAKEIHSDIDSVTTELDKLGFK